MLKVRILVSDVLLPVKIQELRQGLQTRFGNSWRTRTEQRNKLNRPRTRWQWRNSCSLQTLWKTTQLLLIDNLIFNFVTVNTTILQTVSWVLSKVDRQQPSFKRYSWKCRHSKPVC